MGTRRSTPSSIFYPPFSLLFLGVLGDLGVLGRVPYFVRNSFFCCLRGDARDEYAVRPPTMKITDVRTVLLTGPSTNDPFIREAAQAAQRRVHRDPHRPTETRRHRRDLRRLFLPGSSCRTSWSSSSRSSSARRVGSTSIASCGTGCTTAATTGAASGWARSCSTASRPRCGTSRARCCGLPVYELLGGRKHDELPCYATGGPSNYPKDRLAAKVDYYLGLGFTAFKVGAGAVSEAARLVHARPTSGRGRRLRGRQGRVPPRARRQGRAHHARRPHGQQPRPACGTWTTAKAVLQGGRAVRPVLLRGAAALHRPGGYAELCREHEHARSPAASVSTMPTSGANTSPRRRFDIGQPDAAFTGGLGEFVKIAADAREARPQDRDARVGRRRVADAEHPRGVRGANTVHARDPAGFRRPAQRGAGRSLRMKDGMILPPQAPGLGVQLTDEMRRHATRSCPAAASSTACPGRS